MQNGKLKYIDFNGIKQCAPFEQILSYYGIALKLKKTGDSMVGVCPFHGSGKNPRQFRVSLSKNIWHCFGCGKSGSVIDFVKEMEGVRYREAALIITDRFSLSAKKEDTQETNKTKRDNRTLSFRLTLDPNHPYLKKRGLTKKTIKYFGLGYANYGIMKGRIAIPIHNEKGDLIAYAGRSVEDKVNNPKYLFPRGFCKSKIVYNLHHAKKEAKSKGLILVEGYFDVFKIHQAGFSNVVALMGSTLSSEQEELILKASEKIILMFDNDATGKKCTKEVANRLVSKIFIESVKYKGTQPDQLKEKYLHRLLGSQALNI